MTATIKVGIEKVDGIWRGSISATGVELPEQFQHSFENEQEAEQALIRALQKGAELMVQGVVTSIRAVRAVSE